MSEGYLLVIRYALPNDDGTYDLWQVTANESEGLLLRERMGVDILRQFDLECGRNVLNMGLERALAYWIERDRKAREHREREHGSTRFLVAHNVRVLARDGVAIDTKD